MAGVGSAAAPTSVDQASSWAEYLAVYAQIKQRAPPLPEQPPGPRRKFRDARYNKKAQEVAYNPVLGLFRDEREENEQRQHEERKRIETCNRGKDKALRLESHYDIISHQLKPGAAPQTASGAAGAASSPAPPRRNPLASAVCYNIVTNEGDASGAESRHQQRQHPQALAHRANYNIVSNRYFENHECKEAEEKQRSLERSAQLFWRTRSLDPVRAVHVNPDKEVAEQQRERELTRTRLERMRAAMPKSTRESEGMRYNIVSLQPREGAPNAAATNAAEKPPTQHSLKHTAEMRIHERSLAAQALEQDRAINRIAQRRYEENAMHGYDIVTNTPFHDGLSGRPRPPPHGQHQPQGWDALLAANARPRSRSAPSVGGPVRNSQAQ